MMLNNAEKARTDRLNKMAREAINQYNADMAKGGEPLFPDWALDLLGLLDEQDRMLKTLERQKMRIVSTWDFETGERNSKVVQLQQVAP